MNLFKEAVISIIKATGVAFIMVSFLGLYLYNIGIDNKKVEKVYYEERIK